MRSRLLRRLCKDYLTQFIKYTYFYFIDRTIEALIHPKFTGYERDYKLYSLKKLTFDTVFYSTCTIYSYWTFRNEYWFPSMAGGCGECGGIYKDYPNWPPNLRSSMEMYFNIQLGVHLFSVFEMIVIKRKKERKYYEFLLHHFMAASLILFSMMSNQITVGVSILVIHDASDILLAGGRALLDMRFATEVIKAVGLVGCMCTWIYMRIIVFPFCMIANVYANRPTPQDEWYIISFEHDYLLFQLIVLECMHIFWTYMLVKMGVKAAAGEVIYNCHDGKIKK